MVKIMGIIQARMGSTRLPKKVLLKIGNRTLVEHCVARVKKANLQVVVVATSDSSEDDELAEFLQNKGIGCFRGSEDDVLERYYLAAKKYGADLIVRVCADQPFIDPKAITATLLEADSDFTYCKHEKGWPDGTGCEVISFEALKRAQKECNDSFEREHIKPHFLNNKEKYSIKTVDAPAEIYNPNLHFAVDTKEDFRRLSALYTEVNGDVDLVKQNTQVTG
jgi:spore coat polysaccharide biosynthesis protein SpsF